MRKVFMLAFVTLVTSATFAQMMDMGSSGSFSTYFRYATDNDVAKKDRWNDEYSISAGLSMSTTIDEWNSISVDFESVDAAYLDSNDVTPIKSIENKTDFLRLKNFVITSDITGAIGMGHWPVQFSMKIGKQVFPAVTVASVAPESTDDAGGGKTDEQTGFVFDFTILEKLVLSTHLFPTNQFTEDTDSDAEIGFTAMIKDIPLGSAAMLDLGGFIILSESNFSINAGHKDNYSKIDPKDPRLALAPAELKRITVNGVNYIADKTAEKSDTNGNDYGFNLAIKLLDNKLKFGIGIVREEARSSEGRSLDGTLLYPVDEIGFQVDVAYSTDKLTAGISYGTNNVNTLGAKGEKVFGTTLIEDVNVDDSSIILAANYDFFPTLGVYGGVELFFGEKLDSAGKKVAKNPNFEFGINTALKGLAIQIGFTNLFQYKSPEDDWKNNAFIKFSSSF